MVSNTETEASAGDNEGNANSETEYGLINM